MRGLLGMVLQECVQPDTHPESKNTSNCNGNRDGNGSSSANSIVQHHKSQPPSFKKA